MPFAYGYGAVRSELPENQNAQHLARKHTQIQLSLFTCIFFSLQTNYPDLSNQTSYTDVSLQYTPFT